MILVDTSVWIDHFRSSDKDLIHLLNTGQVLAHPFVTGEIALGNLRQRDTVLDALRELPQAVVATDREVLGFIDQHTLFGQGIGYVDVHLLASVRLTGRSTLWARNKRLKEVAQSLGIAAQELP